MSKGCVADGISTAELDLSLVCPVAAGCFTEGGSRLPQSKAFG
jgi:hypothetical protein